MPWAFGPKHTVLIGLVLFCQVTQLNSQRESKIWELKSYWGNFYPGNHISSTTSNVPGDLSALDVRLSWAPKKASSYAKAHRYPTWGIGFFSSLYQPGFLGNYRALYGDVHISILSHPRSRWSWYYSLGTGVGFGFKPYHEELNKENIYIGTQLNAFVRLETFLRFRVAKTWFLQAGIGFHHFSNGSLQLPNKGLNLLPVQFGLQKGWNEPSKTTQTQQMPPLIDKRVIEIKAGLGIKSTSISQLHYHKARLSFHYLQKLNLKYSWGAGLDLFFSSPIPYTNKPPVPSNVSAGISGAWKWHLTERLRVPIQVGFYLNRNKAHDESAAYYQFVGLEYAVDRHWLAAVQLKAHGGSADFIAWTLGYAIPHRSSLK